MKKWTKTALLTGCAGSGSDKSSDAKESYTIGIEQFAEHGSLDNCREGFLQGLEENLMILMNCRQTLRSAT